MITARDIARQDMALTAYWRHNMTRQRRRYTRITSGLDCPELSALCRKHWLRLFGAEKMNAQNLRRAKPLVESDTLGVLGERYAVLRKAFKALRDGVEDEDFFRAVEDFL